RAANAGGEPELLHALLAEADRGRMHEHRDVEIASKQEERPRIIVVRVGAAMARADQHAAQVVLLDGALELSQVLVAAARDRNRERDEAALVAIAQRREILVRLADRRQRLLAAVLFQVVA